MPRLYETVTSVGRKMRKEPIVVKDVPGFASSRLGVALGLEAMRMFEQGVASAQDIDTAMELGYNHPMGPLKLTDLVGLDVRLNIAEYLHRELGSETFRPPEVLRRMVSEGKLGKKTGEGFYDWSKRGCAPRAVVLTLQPVLLNDEYALQQRRETVCLTDVVAAADRDLRSCGRWFCLE